MPPVARVLPGARLCRPHYGLGRSDSRNTVKVIAKVEGSFPPEPATFICVIQPLPSLLPPSERHLASLYTTIFSSSSHYECFQPTDTRQVSTCPGPPRDRDCMVEVSCPPLQPLQQRAWLAPEHTVQSEDLPFPSHQPKIKCNMPTCAQNALRFEGAHSCLVDASCPPLQSPSVHTACLPAKCLFAHDRQCATFSRVPFTNFLPGVRRSFSAYSLGHQPSKGTTMVDASFPPVRSPLFCLCQSLTSGGATLGFIAHCDPCQLLPICISPRLLARPLLSQRGRCISAEAHNTRLAPKHPEDETPAPNYNRPLRRHHPFAISCREEGSCLRIKLGFGPFAHSGYPLLGF